MFTISFKSLENAVINSTLTGYSHVNLTIESIAPNSDNGFDVDVEYTSNGVLVRRVLSYTRKECVKMWRVELFCNALRCTLSLIAVIAAVIAALCVIARMLPGGHPWLPFEAETVMLTFWTAVTVSALSYCILWLGNNWELFD